MWLISITKLIKFIKNRIGEDSQRTNKVINGDIKNTADYLADSNYKSADVLYEQLIKLFNNSRPKTNLNIVNKLAILSCQNVQNIINNIATNKLREIINDNMAITINKNSTYNFVINKNEISFSIKLKSSLVMTIDGNFDPDFPCGTFEYEFYVNLIKDIYELRNMKINYDLDKCGEDNILKPGTNKKTRLRKEYIVPAAALTAGIVATPLLLTMLGGKTRRKKRILRKIKRFTRRK